MKSFTKETISSDSFACGFRANPGGRSGLHELRLDGGNLLPSPALWR